MSKQPWRKWFWSDYIGDTRRLSYAARGAWVDVIYQLDREPDHRGTITATMREWAAMTSGSEEEFRAALSELKIHGTADISVGEKGAVTVTCRRMLHEETKRERIRIAVADHRERKRNVNDREKTPNPHPCGDLSDVQPECNQKEISDVTPKVTPTSPLPYIPDARIQIQESNTPPPPLGENGGGEVKKETIASQRRREDKELASNHIEVPLVEAWNKLVPKIKAVRRITSFGPGRRRLLKALLMDAEWSRLYLRAIEEIPSQSRLSDPHRTWPLTVDWFLRMDPMTGASTVDKILSGIYSDEGLSKESPAPAKPKPPSYHREFVGYDDVTGKAVYKSDHSHPQVVQDLPESPDDPIDQRTIDAISSEEEARYEQAKQEYEDVMNAGGIPKGDFAPFDPSPEARAWRDIQRAKMREDRIGDAQ